MSQCEFLAGFGWDQCLHPQIRLVFIKCRVFDTHLQFIYLSFQTCLLAHHKLVLSFCSAYLKCIAIDL